MAGKRIGVGSKVIGPGEAEYTVSEIVDSGSCGTVYKAQADASGEIFAVKTLSIGAVSGAEIAALLNEGASTLDISHPNVIKYHYFHDGTRHENLPPYILMEYAEGGSLYTILEAARAAQNHFSSEQVTNVFRQLVCGMRAVNAVLVHRDIKPSNILVHQELFKITDFGLAKMVSATTRDLTFKGCGTLPYMAPEAWRSDENTVALDAYALGVVFYELATLRHPFTVNSNDPQKWKEAHLYAPVEVPSKYNAAVGTRISQIIMQMLEKKVTKRLSDWDKILQLLEQAEPASEEHRASVSAMLRKRLDEDAEARVRAAEEQRKHDEKNEFCKIVLFQVQNDVIDPLNGLFAEFNRHYSGEPITMSVGRSSQMVTVRIAMPSGKSVHFDFHVLLEDVFRKSVRRRDDFGDFYERVEDTTPCYKQRKILGWSTLQAPDGRGCNLLLVEQGDEIYGEWIMLINTAGFFADRMDRPEPFAFGFSELEDGVRLIDVMGRYQVRAKPLDLGYIADFVTAYV